MKKNNVDIIIRKVALYLRLSKEDIEKPTKESISESIKNQELMLREEVKKHPDWKIVGIFCDEDFSGAGTYRPDFEKMINMCKNDEVDVVLCKSQSRFSRDMEVIEKYLHNKFIEWGVRFVSIIDNADTSNKGNKKARQINALVNEWFLEDLSDNIKATFRTKWENGECTSSFAKYGFMKDPKNKNHLLIDPIAAQVKHQIKNLIMLGYGQDKIANILEEKNIPSPYEYKAMNGCKLQLPISKKQDPFNITKAGNYIIKVSLYNKYKLYLNNIISVFVLGTKNEKTFNSKFLVRVRSVADDLKLYYTTTELPNIDAIKVESLSFTDGIWKQVKVNDKIPNKVTYIACYNSELDRLLETGFELEVTLKENRQQNSYKLFSKTISSPAVLLNFEYEIRKKYKWSGRSVIEVVRDPLNNGILEQGKTRRISYKNHKCMPAPKEQYVICKNAVEKTFNDEEWLDLLNTLNKRSRAGASNGIKHIFSGKVYCALCGNILIKNTSKHNKESKKIEYLICKDKSSNWANCDNNKSIRLDELENCVINSINEVLKKYYDPRRLKENKTDMIASTLFSNQLDSFNKEKCDIQKLIKKKKSIFQQLYEDRTNGIIDNYDFSTLRLKYKEDVSKLNDRLAIIEDELKIIEAKQNKFKNKDNLFAKYKQITNLTPVLINQFIDKIEIGKVNKVTNKREINIFWNF